MARSLKAAGWRVSSQYLTLGCMQSLPLLTAASVPPPPTLSRTHKDRSSPYPYQYLVELGVGRCVSEPQVVDSLKNVSFLCGCAKHAHLAISATLLAGQWLRYQGCTGNRFNPAGLLPFSDSEFLRDRIKGLLIFSPVPQVICFVSVWLSMKAQQMLLEGTGLSELPAVPYRCTSHACSSELATKQI